MVSFLYFFAVISKKSKAKKYKAIHVYASESFLLALLENGNLVIMLTLSLEDISIWSW